MLVSRSMPRRRPLLLSLALGIVLLLAALPAPAQAPPAPCSEDPGFHELDFWLGEWRVLVGEQEVGTNSIEAILSGCAVREQWTSARGSRGESLFYYQPVTKVWQQVWVTDGARGRGGVKEKTLVETLADGSLRFQGEVPLAEGGTYLDRTTLSPLPDGRVRQRIEVSSDGVAWRVVFDATYVRVGGTTPPATAAAHDAWLEALAREPARLARVAEELRALGGTPLREADGALFLAEGDPASPPRLIGDFNGWGERRAESEMRRVGESRLFALRLPIADDARVEYRIGRSGEERPDPWNPRSVEAFRGRNSEVRMPGYVAPPEIAALPTGASGRIETFGLESRILGNRRAIRVYLPPGYDEAAEGGRRYPLVLLGDGELYAGALGIPARLDLRIARGELEPLVAAFVDVTDRRSEYDRSSDYRRMVVEELLPRLEAGYRVERDPARRAIAGSSRGALAALDVALAHPAHFGAVGAMAPALAPWTVGQLLEGRPPVAVRAVVRRARYDDRFGADAVVLAEGLVAAGGSVDYAEIPEGHNRETWALRFDELLSALFPRVR